MNNNINKRCNNCKLKPNCDVWQDKNETTVSKAAEYFAMLLKKSLGKRVLGPAKPVVGRVKQLYINEILLKMELGFSITHIREIIKLQEATTRERIRFRYVRIHYEIDV